MIWLGSQVTNEFILAIKEGTLSQKALWKLLPLPLAGVCPEVSFCACPCDPATAPLPSTASGVEAKATVCHWPMCLLARLTTAL